MRTVISLTIASKEPLHLSADLVSPVVISQAVKILIDRLFVQTSVSHC